MKKIFRACLLGVSCFLAVVVALAIMDRPMGVRKALASSIGEFRGNLWGHGGGVFYGFRNNVRVVTGTTLTLTDDDCGKIISNYGATGDTAITWGTHPNGFYIYLADATADNYTQSVDPPDAMQILQETDAAGDRISTTTSGFFGKLTQVSATSICLEGAATSLLEDEN